MYTGPNLTNDDLVFGYDTGYGIANNNTATRFYHGKPSVNLFGDISNANGRPNRTEYNTSAWTADFPKPPEDVGRVYSHTSGSLNSTWSGNSYGYTLISYSYSANTTYTLSCWVYVSSDANLSAMAMSMEGTTLTHTANRNYDLNNKGTWQQLSLRCNSSSVVNGNAIIAYPSRNGVTDGSHTGFWAIGGAKLEISDQVTPYVLGTRSSTASLIDLKTTKNIDLSNASFDSTGQPIFDGTSDYISVPSTAYSFPYGATVEQVIKFTAINRQQGFFTLNHVGGAPSGANIFINFWMSTNNLMRWEVIGDSAGTYATINATTAVTVGKYYHFVGVFNGTTTTIYVNGVAETTQTMTNQPLAATSQMETGRYGSSYPSASQIPVTRFYNQPLTAGEVQSNYKAYKNRFNI